MLIRKIVAVCSEVRKKHRNTIRDQNEESFLVKSADI